LTRGDVFVVAGALLLAVLIWAGFYLIPGDSGILTAVVRIDGTEVARMPVTGECLSERQVTLRGGIAIVEFGQGRVRVLPLSSPICRDGICWKTGWISRSGQSIVCVPNHMTITLEGAGSGVDSVVR
jgi:hypothetical protein